MAFNIEHTSPSKSTTEPILWGVASQWRIFWDFGELGRALVLTSISGLCRIGYHSPTTTMQNACVVAGAVFAHSIAQTSAANNDTSAYPTLVSVILVFNSHPTLLGDAMDCVVLQLFIL